MIRGMLIWEGRVNDVGNNTDVALTNTGNPNERCPLSSHLYFFSPSVLKLAPKFSAELHWWRVGMQFHP